MIADAPTLGLGAAVLAVGVDWRVRAIRRRRADFRGRARSALEDQDPATRRAAVSVVTQQGLSEVAELLLETIERESDVSVLDAIAEAVARNQWEPSHRREMFELRLWAQRRLEERAERRREEEAVSLELLLLSGASRVSDGPLTDGAARLDELFVFDGHAVPAVSEGSRGRALALMAADGWRRLRVARASSPEQQRTAAHSSNNGYELMASNGHGPPAVSGATRGRTLALAAADRWRRLAVARSSRAKQDSDSGRGR